MDPETQKLLQFPKVQRILQLIGLMATVWNEIERDCYLVYTCFMLPLSRGVIDHIYKNFATFPVQKEFIRHLAQKALEGKADYLKNLLKECNAIFEAIKELQHERNQAVHGLYSFDLVNGMPSLRSLPSGSHTKRTNRYAGIDDLEEELTITFDKIETLSHRLNTFRLILTQEFLPDGHNSVPMKPEVLATMSQQLRDALPREQRERIAPPELRNPNR